jgi:hypothetical protein
MWGRCVSDAGRNVLQFQVLTPLSFSSHLYLRLGIRGSHYVNTAPYLITWFELSTTGVLFLQKKWTCNFHFNCRRCGPSGMWMECEHRMGIG